MAQPTRRIVTGHDADGNSIFVSDGAAPAVRLIEAFGGMAVTELWQTDEMPVSNAGNEDRAHKETGLEPSPMGSKFRVVEYPPDSVRFAGADRAAGFAEIGGREAMVAGDRHPGMHKTATVDYAIVLSGEIWAVMDRGEVLMKAGDVLVQRGTSHAWSNRTDAPCRVAFVLIDAAPVA
jgi:mannose-6-phosphate isomerase-like protein (cupin superfamily)